FLDAARANERERTDDMPDELLAQLVDARADPHAKTQHAQVLGALKRALAGAIAGLAKRDRTFLRHVVIDQLTTIQIAAIYGVHRVTGARPPAAAHAHLRQHARAGAIAELGVSSGQLDSAIQVVDSQLELSLDRIFKELDRTVA